MTLGIDASRAEVGEKTGVEWYSIEIIRRLKNYVPADWRVVLYSRNGKLESLGELPKNWSVQIIHSSLPRLWTLGTFSRYLSKTPPDILFVPSHIIPTHAPQRTITMIPDVAWDRFPKSFPWRERIVLQLGLRRAKNCARTLVPSHFTKSELIRLGFDESNITVTQLGIDHERFHPYSHGEIEESLRELALDRPYVLYVGRLDAKKNGERLLQAWQGATIPDMDLVMTGRDGYQSQKIRQRADKISSVKMLGWCDPRLIPHLYAGATAVALPSLYEGFGLPALEAAASGVPLLASDIPPIHEMVGNAAVYVNPLEVDSIAKGLQQIVSDATTRQKNIDEALFRAQRFSWDRATQETWDVIASLV